MNMALVQAFVPAIFVAAGLRFLFASLRGMSR